MRKRSLGSNNSSNQSLCDEVNSRNINSIYFTKINKPKDKIFTKLPLISLNKNKLNSQLFYAKNLNTNQFTNISHKFENQPKFILDCCSMFINKPLLPDSTSKKLFCPYRCTIKDSSKLKSMQHSFRLKKESIKLNKETMFVMFY